MRLSRHELRQAGYTLIELMIAVGIVAILARLAYASYMSSVQKGDRADAKNALLTASQVLERCYSQYYSYNNAGCPAIQTASTNNFYTITTPTLTASAYKLTATASGGPQTADKKCASFSIDQAGNQTALDSNGNDNSTYCWTGHN